MLSTIVYAAVFVGLLLASAGLWAWFLRLGLRWAKVPDVTLRRVVFTTVIVIIAQCATSVLLLFASRSPDAQLILLGYLELAAAVVVPCVVISTVFEIRFRGAVQAWLPTLLATVVTLAFAHLVVRPFLYEAFVTPANSMAPTIIGPHWRGTCPVCGKSNYCSPGDERYDMVDLPQMICDEFHVTTASDIEKSVYSGDHFTVAKIYTPRRWDLVVFQYPEEPSALYVKRLVGLPGEKIHIDDGSVWVDGVRQTAPESMRGIEYLSELPDYRIKTGLWGSVSRPALLGPDEYFVLGDFSAHSNDSRLWEQGTPGHNPFAVPESHMKGVVIHTFWPPHRWRVHR